MKIFKEFFVLLVSYFIFVEGDFKCEPSQYFEIGSNGTLDCSFPRVFQAVYWYDSPDTNANIIVGMEIQDSGSFSRTGSGFLNGSYDISDEGHLTIRNITPVHDRTLKAVLVDENNVISNYIVTVVTTYNLEGNYPVIDACHIKHKGTNNCVVSFIGSLVKCTYSNSRPAVSLSWQVEYPTQKKHSVKGSDNVYLDSKFTYTATSTLEISEIANNPLIVLTCSAFGPAITTDNVNSSVIVGGTNSSYVDWQNFTKYDQYIYINSREGLHCNNRMKKSSAYMWKYETREAAEVLTYFINGQEWQSDTLSGVSFTKEGSLVFENMTVAQEGTYTCVTVDNELSALTAINVNVIVPPSPPGIDVAGCPTVNNDCELFLSNNTSILVSCNVTGVKPKISLSIQSLNSSGVTILTRESIENNQGDLFNAAIVAEVELQENATCPFILACVASGPGSQSFNPSRIISLVPDKCQYFVVSRSVYKIYISTAGVLLLLIVMAVCVIVRRKMAMSSKRGWDAVDLSDSPVINPVNKPVPLNPKDLPDAIMLWPLGNVDSYEIFDQEAIDLLRNISKEIEQNRTRKNLGVAGGAVAGVVGGGLSIAGAALLPFTFGASVGLIIAGGTVGAAGAGFSVGFSLEKLFKDKKRVKIVQPALDEFIEIQKELATTVALLSVIYDIVEDDRFRESFDEANNDELRSMLRDVVSSYDQYHPNINEKLATIHRFTESMTKHFIHNPDDENQDDETKLATELTLIDEDWHRSWQEKLNEAKSSPFDVLDNAINQLRQATTDRSTDFTFLMLVNILYVDVSEDAEKLQQDTTQLPVDQVHPAGAAAGATAVAGTVGRVAVGFGDDAAKIGTNVFRVVKGLTVAGIVLSAVGIAVDLAFLGHAVKDLLDTKKEQFSQALTDVADIMAKMNKLTSTFAKLDNKDT